MGRIMMGFRGAVALSATVALVFVSGCSLVRENRKTLLPIHHDYDIAYRSAAQQKVVSRAFEYALDDLQHLHVGPLSLLKGRTAYVTVAGFYPDNYSDSLAYVLARTKGILAAHGCIIQELPEDYNLKAMLEDSRARRQKKAKTEIGVNVEVTSAMDSPESVKVSGRGEDFAFPEVDYIVVLSLGAFGADIIREKDARLKWIGDLLLDLLIIGWFLPDMHEDKILYDGNVVMHLSALHQRPELIGFDISSEGHHVMRLKAKELKRNNYEPTTERNEAKADGRFIRKGKGMLD